LFSIPPNKLVLFLILNEIMDARERFFEVRDALGLTDYRIYTDVKGVTKSMLDRLRQGVTTEVSNKWLIPFLEAYPQVNANYILTGRGSMFIFDRNNVDSFDEKLTSEMTALKRENKRLEEQLDTLSKLYYAITGENNVIPSSEADFYKAESDFYKKNAERLILKVIELEAILEEAKIPLPIEKKAE
jgi:hypothetical protein